MIALANEGDCPVTYDFAQVCVSHGNVSGKEYSKLFTKLITSLNVPEIRINEQQDSLEIIAFVFLRVNEEAFAACVEDERVLFVCP